MKKKGNKHLKIGVATMIAIFALANSFVATYAWFAMNTSVTASGMNIRLNNEGQLLTMLTIHRCNSSASTDNNLVFFSEPAVTISQSGISNSYVAMDNYSDLNKAQPLLLLFGLNNGVEQSQVTITAKSDNENYVSTITEDNISSFPFSTTVSFKSASFTSDSFPFNNVSLSSFTQSSSFVTIANHSFSSYSSQINIFEGGNSSTVIKYVAVIMDYYPEAREVLLTNNVGVDLLAANNNNVISFYCDWTLEIQHETEV